MKNRVIMVSEPKSREFVEDMHMLYAPSLEKALETAENITGKNSDIVVIPDGVGVIVSD
jgi:nickel-dependent lactate racemase